MSDEEIRDFWKRSISEQYAAIHPARRRECVWRASADTIDLLRRILDEPMMMLWPLPMAEPIHIVGLPVEIDPSAEGITLQCPERVR